jgi:hypothetical protein
MFIVEVDEVKDISSSSVSVSGLYYKDVGSYPLSAKVILGWKVNKSNNHTSFPHKLPL